ncbi:hypothetical protein Purlil1_12933 [Purpureocillium lilacinum]|uniref:Uncharacterized protein n=1 Tax=Purpureocillium lilacinum TaxID=33203 RepID=A0ABR0BFH5_PURLI|nr:hypothetical protein Purlil1_12933 [Purpureocillium lilacinum]
MATTLFALVALLLTGFIGTVSVLADFIHPPPWIKDSKRPFQDNARYTWGTEIAVEWKNDHDNETNLLLGLHFPRKIEQPDSDWFQFINKGKYHEVLFPCVYLIICPEAEFLKRLPSSVTTASWNVTLFGNEDLVPAGSDAICYLSLWYAGTNFVIFSSSYFNVSLPRKEPSTTIANSGTTTSVGTSASIMGPTGVVSTSTATPSANSEPSSSARLSSAAAAGIGVGVTLGSILALSGLGVTLRRRYKRRREAMRAADEQQRQRPPEQEPRSESEPQVTQKPSELDACMRKTVISELDGSSLIGGRECRDISDEP